MDLKTFAEVDFDSKQWINRTWSSNSHEDKEVFVANTVARLQLYMRQLANSLDETTSQIVASVPRVLQDAASLQVEGALLQNKLLDLEKKVYSVEEQTGQSIKSLQKIDALKSRLENAASALQEADKWAHLATSLEDVLEGGVPTQGERLTELTKQVTAMTASLEVLSEAPDYENKQIQLEALYNRLEAALGPAVVDALTQRNAESAGALVRTFAAMRRVGAPVRYWRRVEASRLAAEWRREPHAPRQALRELRAALAQHAYAQVDWLTDVLKCETPLNELVRLYTDLLLSLDPSPSKVVSASLKLCSTPQESIELLTDVRTDIDEFVSNFKTLLDTERQNKESVLPAATKELGRALYAPLRESLSRYTELQAQVLTAYLRADALEQTDPLERARAIHSAIDRSDTWLKQAHNTARKLAGNAVYPYFIPAVEAYTSALCSQLSSTSRQVETEFLAASAKGSAQGVLSPTFPASLVLAAASAALVSILGALRDDLMRHVAVVESITGLLATRISPEAQQQSPLPPLETLLLDEAGKAALAGLRRGPGASAEAPWVAGAEDLARLCRTLRSLAVNILLEPVALQLEKIPHMQAWSGNDAIATDLPDFSVSPQEYITVVGQYLMTLPQHLEPHLTEKQAPWHFLNEVCNQTCDMYSEKLLNLRNLDQLGTKRCLTDIAYLSSVLEDLGCSITSSLSNLERSLRSTTRN